MNKLYIIAALGLSTSLAEYAGDCLNPDDINSSLGKVIYDCGDECES